MEGSFSLVLTGEIPMSRPPFVIEENSASSASTRAQHEQAQKNLDWLQYHWPDLLPPALGKFVAVAGQQAFIADSPAEARSRAIAAHPEDKGVLVQYVRPEKGPHIYGNG
jgi:hypothetical protein